MAIDHGDGSYSVPCQPSLAGSKLFEGGYIGDYRDCIGFRVFGLGSKLLKGGCVEEYERGY